MSRRRRSQAVRILKQQAEVGLYRMTDHVLTEMDDDNLNESDIVTVIVKGKMVKKQGGDARGPRYVFRGKIDDGREVEVVCRSLGARVSIITAYQV